jgi:hypothetical protein
VEEAVPQKMAGKSAVRKHACPVDFIFVEVANLQVELGCATFSYPEPALHAIKRAWLRSRDTRMGCDAIKIQPLNENKMPSVPLGTSITKSETQGLSPGQTRKHCCGKNICDSRCFLKCFPVCPPWKHCCGNKICFPRSKNVS